MAIFPFEDIIKPGNPFADVIKYLEILDKQANETITKMIALEKSIKAINQTGGGGEAKLIIENTEKLAKETEKLTALQKAELAIKNQIIAGEAKLVASYSSEAEQLRHVKVESQILNKQKENEAKLNSQLTGSYQKLSIELNQLREKYKNLAAEEKHTTTEGKQLLSQITQLDVKLKQIDKSVGQYPRVIGDYQSAWGKVGATLKDIFLGGGILFAVQRLGQSLISFFKTSTAEAQQAEKSFAKVEQAITSTGNAAGFSASQIKAFDDELEAATNIDADTIMNDVSAQLLTFTKLSGDEFIRTQKAALDVATVLGGDGQLSLKSVAIQLGKAMQDPVKGLTALRKSGISFSESQREVIKSLVATGQQAEAQRLILSELEKQYGGQAEAASKAGLGPLEKLKIQWNNVKELIGTGLIKVINYFAEVAGGALTKVMGFFKTSLAYIVDFINGWIELYNESLLFRAVIEAISTTFSITWKTVKLFFTLMGNAITNIGEQLGYTFNPKNWGKGFADGLSEIIQRNKGETLKDLKDYGKDVANTFKDGIKSVAKGKVSLLEFASDKQTTSKTGGVIGDDNVIKDNSKELEKLASERAKKAKELNEFLVEQEQLAYTEEEKLINENAQAKIDADQAVWDFKLADYERQKELKDLALKEEIERQETLKQIVTEAAIATGEQIGELLAKGQLSFKQFGKIILATALEIGQRQLLIIGTEILAKEIAKKSFFGIASSAILISAITAAFAGVKAKVQNFATGSEYVNGAGTETSDSIQANLSKGERVVPANINRQLMGIKNRDLPNIVQNGMNTQRMETLLDEMKHYTMLTAQFVSSGANIYVENGYLVKNDWKTGTITRQKIND